MSQQDTLLVHPATFKCLQLARLKAPASAVERRNGKHQCSSQMLWWINNSIEIYAMIHLCVVLCVCWQVSAVAGAVPSIYSCLESPDQLVQVS
jgi:hypothetical protein